MASDARHGAGEAWVSSDAPEVTLPEAPTASSMIRGGDHSAALAAERHIPTQDGAATRLEFGLVIVHDVDARRRKDDPKSRRGEAIQTIGNNAEPGGSDKSAKASELRGASRHVWLSDRGLGRYRLPGRTPGVFAQFAATERLANPDPTRSTIRQFYVGQTGREPHRLAGIRARRSLRANAIASRRLATRSMPEPQAPK
jgi:hypothetical protein